MVWTDGNLTSPVLLFHLIIHVAIITQRYWKLKRVLIVTASMPDLGAHPASLPTGTRATSPGVKRPGRQADHSPSSGAEVKYAQSYTSYTSLIKPRIFQG